MIIIEPGVFASNLRKKPAGKQNQPGMAKQPNWETWAKKKDPTKKHLPSLLPELPV